MLPFLCTCMLLLNPLNAELNPICHLLALLGDHHILHVSRIRVNYCTLSYITWRIFHSDTFPPFIPSPFFCCIIHKSAIRFRHWSSRAPLLVYYVCELRAAHGRAMTQAVSRRPLAAENRVRSQVSSCEICSVQSGIETGYSRSFPPLVSLHH